MNSILKSFALLAAVLLFASSEVIGGELAAADSASPPACCANPHAAPVSETHAVSDLRKTLDPAQFQGDVRQAYKVAQENPELLVQLHCYCGCDRANGHKNLLDCYRDHHGASCAICTGEALEAKKLYDQGASIATIQQALKARFAGNASN